MTETIRGSSGFIRGRKRLISPLGQHEELLEVPLDAPRLAVLVLGLGEFLVERRRLLAVDAHLVHHRERDAPGHRAVLEDVVHLRQLLEELIAREGEHVESAVAVGLLELLELLVLGRESASRGDVDDQQHLAVVVGQSGLPAIGRREGDVADVDRGGLGHTHRLSPNQSRGPRVWDNGEVTPTLAPARTSAHRADRARCAGRARADGRDHQHRLPAPVPRVRRRSVRQRDDHLPRAGRAQRHDDAAHHAPRVRDAALDPALRRRPRHGRGRGADSGRRGSRRPHRSQLRLPRAQGHPQGRRGGAARGSSSCSATSSPAPRARPATFR